jgi:hypothetical protein
VDRRARGARVPVSGCDGPGPAAAWPPAPVADRPNSELEGEIRVILLTCRLGHGWPFKRLMSELACTVVDLALRLRLGRAASLLRRPLGGRAGGAGTVTGAGSDDRHCRPVTGRDGRAESRLPATGPGPTAADRRRRLSQRLSLTRRGLALRAVSDSERLGIRATQALAGN